MALLLNDPYAYLDTFLLIFVRSLGVILIVPIFGNKNIPNLMKVALTFFLSILVLSSMPFEPVVSSADTVRFAMAVVQEFIIGWLIGFSAYIVFSVLSLAGQFIDMQIGFSMVNVFDPLSQIQLTITGNLYYYMLIIITLITNAHHFIIRAILQSYTLIPLGQLNLSPLLYDTIVNYMSRYVQLALGIAAPIFLVMIITNVVLGILARTVPQLNMFVIGFPIKIILGVSTIFITLALFTNISELLISDSEEMMLQVVRGLMP